MVVITVVSRVVCDLVVNAGPWGAGIAAAKRDSVQQILSVNIAADSAIDKKTDMRCINIMELLHLERCAHFNRFK